MKDNFSTTIDNKYPKNKSESSEFLQDENKKIICKPLTFQCVGVAALEKGYRNNYNIKPTGDSCYQEFRRNILNSESHRYDIKDTLG